MTNHPGNLDNLNKAEGVFGIICLLGCLLGAVVTFFIGVVSHDFGPFGMCCAGGLVSMFIAASSGKPSQQPVYYCRRCGTRHALPLGPNCYRG